ncbi:AAA family ATPase [Paludisphaera borealis]|uniref:DNA replication and repair protein RecF n=1 Tax=Paludisphaera borealis TaxID=1387353 RepID=A0A1U7CNP3_9BACT|nr:ATP-binding protein [Paludisphaera borealis]APW60529.1 DNA replication and repair protein RecF [Paludisphaera borealis]
MLSRLLLKNLTVFSEAEFDFAPGLNVVAGENGAGKSHVLKAAYTIAAVLARGEKESGSSTPTKSYLETAIARKLRGVFRPDELGRLARRQAGRVRCEVGAEFSASGFPLAFSFNTTSKTEVVVAYVPDKWEKKPPVFLPTRELLTIYPGFVSLYDMTDLSFEETWRDTCILLGAPLAKGARLSEIKELLEPLEKQLGGTVVVDQERFYVKTRSGNLEAHLVAEGLRKLAMIARLIATGSLVGKGALFWDEPEANLNPKVIKKVARTILQLCKSGIQVFVASHSLFLMRELDILLKNNEFRDVKTKFFGLHPSADGVTVQQGETVDDVGTIDALQEELSQSDRYLGVETS